MQAITEILTRNGYIINRPPIDVIMYIKGYGEDGFENEVYHIHVRYLGDYSELYFRDYLCEHPEISKEYGELKRVLKEKNEHDRDAYTAAKGNFVGRITALARMEYGNRYI